MPDHGKDEGQFWRERREEEEYGRQLTPEEREETEEREERE